MVENNLIFEMLKKKKLGQFSKNYRTFYNKKLSLSSQKYVFGIRDQPIPDPGFRGQKSTGSGSATLLVSLCP
jgi:hypothetical protein